MRILVPRETDPEERRVPMVPAVAARFVQLGAELVVEAGCGEALHYADEDYAEGGASIAESRAEALTEADVVLRLRKPPLEEVGRLKRGCIHISFLEPFDSPDLIRALAEAEVSAIGMEMIPRTTLAQKMDALSSQATLAGYLAVILAAERLDKIFPMMMTPAGTVAPARVFVIGAGVAGLQAIATAKRLGARVEAFDTRPAVEEQVASLGAKFVKVDLGETGEGEGGYARKLTEDQLEKQRQVMTERCAAADVVITTAQVFGREAPLIVTEKMLKGMRPGSVIVDLAIESGGNVASSRLDEEVLVDAVRVVAPSNLPGQVPLHASQMYANNLYNLVEHFWDKDTNSLKLDLEDEIIQGCLVTHGGEICNEMIREHIG
ncbi:MAG: Re/Si-specific NAD(P)(+) transhydrogenase subunit alpha [Planctomycetota bacterium]